MNALGAPSLATNCSADPELGATTTRESCFLDGA